MSRSWFARSASLRRRGRGRCRVCGGRRLGGRRSRLRRGGCRPCRWRCRSRARQERLDWQGAATSQFDREQLCSCLQIFQARFVSVCRAAARSRQTISRATRAARLADQATIAVVLRSEFSQPLSGICEFLLGGSHAHVSWHLYDNGRLVCSVSRTASLCLRLLLSTCFCCNLRASQRVPHLAELGGSAKRSTLLFRICTGRLAMAGDATRLRRFVVSVPPDARVRHDAHPCDPTPLEREPFSRWLDCSSLLKTRPQRFPRWLFRSCGRA